ncbi:MAG: hypothetical protein JGK24_10145 [Microcoleus sp. PH2017_29_MFU_D_A]|jgi:hypothetical protein|nr:MULTISPECIES: hypothetical protein [unclassified Microcoleus]MCC3418163.1 hypothetical protein [Microcoleus sp. PH2017_07_MST_O_A]MCC3502954.1 hypothetical protein [Microcoleus sp. PH2017_19_SFW_U_A]MCC3567310.1 hypothetical protein [Microcoleus sp. PH2017_31_RDM_U_A]MCC3450227.1 hypothetical protein [Microcoleus sp. PH2017_09_SFU_O_A]MCC3455552.1 hypothetical protein [Microcoleus sp. PH2017_08_TRC_O_A]
MLNITDSLASIPRQFLARRNVLKDRSNFFEALIAVAILLLRLPLNYE